MKKDLNICSGLFSFSDNQILNGHPSVFLKKPKSLALSTELSCVPRSKKYRRKL